MFHWSHCSAVPIIRQEKKIILLLGSVKHPPVSHLFGITNSQITRWAKGLKLDLRSGNITVCV